MALSHAHSIRSYPAIGELFELGFDGNYQNNQPLEIVRLAHGDSRGWAHDDELLVIGRAIRQFKLIELKLIMTFDEVLAELARHGKVSEGQWIQGFKAAFPKTDGKGPIGIADASWVAPDGRPNFPYIGRGGSVSFHRALGTFGPNWRWIVPA